MPPIAAPTPIPTFALLDRLLPALVRLFCGLGVGDVVGPAVVVFLADAVDNGTLCMPLAAGVAVAEVDNTDKSFDSKATVIGDANISHSSGS